VAPEGGGGSVDVTGPAGLVIRNGEILGPRGPERAEILIRHGVIDSVTPTFEAAARGDEEIIDANGKLVIPGLINAHLHSHEHFNRGRFDNLPLEVWQLYSRPPLGFPPLTPRHVYLRTMIGCIEMIRSGTTTAFDDVVHVPLVSEELADAVAQAYVDAGMRARVSCHVMDRPIYDTIPYLADLLPAHLRAELDANPRPPAKELLDFARSLLGRFPRADGRVGLALAPSAPQRCTDGLLVEMAALASAAQVPLMSHVLETQAQVVTGHRFYGKSIVQHMDDLGILTPNAAIAHGVWLTDPDIALVAERQVSVVHNPVSNLKLGAGIAPVRALLRAWVNVGLGCDGTGSNDTQNMFDAMKFAALLNKVRGDPFEDWVGAREAFRMVTIGGARAALLDGVGEIRPGYRADLVVLDLRRIAFVPRNDLVHQLVFCEKGDSVETVIIDGRVVLRDRRLTTVDEEALLAEIVDMYEHVRTKRTAADEHSARLLPYFREAWRRCAAEPVPVNAYARRGAPGRDP
jgi:5-methylthioadenosine/S-adenosylhomocysteine deaminase